MRIGVLTLQGDYAAHARALARLGVEAVGVRRPADLEGLHGLILPGGESSALLRLMQRWSFLEALRSFSAGGGALFGTCAGLILLAREVRGIEQPCLGLLDVAVERNSYGRQRESFAVPLAVPVLGAAPFDAVFIRAPRVVALGPGAAALASYGESPVLVRNGRVLGASFHPELTEDARLLAYFLDRIVSRGAPA
ncbi:MAG: pyridoxal 5'-phosphate synthase glutaminase subunit PdxT [Planctomycetes bacterium]|nr:pyridoxal 5'-phosphate synthase glutaminase subunit PdxT [Planctomycetota bacterium]